jgi:hypothetical protein
MAKLHIEIPDELKEQLREYAQDETGRWRGGLVVSDPAGHQPGSLLFGP